MRAFLIILGATFGVAALAVVSLLVMMFVAMTMVAPDGH